MRRVLENIPPLCLENGCLRLAGHQGKCSPTPVEAWAFMKEKDKDKLQQGWLCNSAWWRKGSVPESRL